MAVALLQLLDWHSTLLSHSGHVEANPLLHQIEQWGSFALWFSGVKLAFLGLLIAGFAYWRRRKGLYEREFTVCLLVLVVVYGAVVLNNYLT